jgi:DNA repair protein RadA/Sms
MSKINKIFSCSKCGAQFSKWNGRCLECGGWGTLNEDMVDDRAKDKKERAQIPAAEMVDLSKMESNKQARIVTNIGEINRVLGGGLVPGSITLISGDPGVGKSTLLAQVADALAQKNHKVAYFSGEESATQIKDRLERLNCDLQKIDFAPETNVERINSRLRKDKPALAIIDSIQTVYSSMRPSEIGSVGQIRAATISFLEVAKQQGIAIILVGHITKDGQVAGPKSLEHIVDTVLYLESDKRGEYRILRSQKNRFGSVAEVGIFEMTGTGMKEVKNPSGIFVDENIESMPGAVTSVVMEGTRPFLVEVQALVTKTVFGYPQRKASGFDLNRLQVLTAVLTKRGNINLGNQDVIVNIVGGQKISDPALDLAVSTAILSSLLNIQIKKDTVVIGEVGLGGEVRKVAKQKERLSEAKKLGYSNYISSDNVKNVGEIKNSI